MVWMKYIKIVTPTIGVLSILWMMFILVGIFFVQRHYVCEGMCAIGLYARFVLFFLAFGALYFTIRSINAFRIHILYILLFVSSFLLGTQDLYEVLGVLFYYLILVFPLSAIYLFLLWKFNYSKTA